MGGRAGGGGKGEGRVGGRGGGGGEWTKGHCKGCGAVMIARRLTGQWCRHCNAVVAVKPRFVHTTALTSGLT